jgi:hypothetical protein
MRRLAELCLVVRLERRVGGIRSGSDGYIYGLSGLGHAVLDLGQVVRRRHRRVPETKLAFESHVLAVSELAVCLGEHALAGRCVVEEFRAEPGSWRPFGGLGGGIRVLKPDAYVRLGVGEYETTAFIEQDMATESLPTIGRKLNVYVDYWRSGIEQDAHEVFPRVWWLVPNTERLTALQRTVQQLPPHTHDLFTVALTDHAPDLLTQLPGSEGGAL